jgi:hypothetical protein
MFGESVSPNMPNSLMTCVTKKNIKWHKVCFQNNSNAEGRAVMLSQILTFCQLDNLHKEIPPEEMAPQLHPTPKLLYFRSTAPMWVLLEDMVLGSAVEELDHLLQFPVEFIVSHNGSKSSLVEVFILTLMKLAKGYTNMDLAEHLCYSNDVIAGYIGHLMMNLLINKANGLLHGGAACLQCWALK